MTIYFSVMSGKIAKSSYESAMEQRHHQVKPNIELMNTVAYSTGIDHVLLQFRNSGLGTALGLRLMIGYDDSMGFKVDHLFHPIGSIIDSSGNILPEINGVGKDWISPNEALECAVDSPRDYAKFRTTYGSGRQIVYSIYLSYFDVDGTEYLKLFKNLGASRLVALYVNTAEGILDSLRDMSKRVELGTSLTLEYPGLRDESGWFKIFRKSGLELKDSLR
ncbi:MAG: hypothetical protein PHR28_08365 [candidate division Zixibacteria bacterium]|nr:hypothetical protein [candidate division Zixibacteria bacterium]